MQLLDGALTDVDAERQQAHCGSVEPRARARKQRGVCDTVAAFDLMAFFNPYRRSYIDDPYPALARLRSEEPVHRSREFDAWVLTRYAECAEVLRDHGAFASNPSHGSGSVASELERQRKEVSVGEAAPLVRSDPPAHTRLRRSMHRAFTPGAVAALRPHIEATVDALLAEVTPERPFELMGGLAEPLPVLVILELLGVPGADRDAVRGWIASIMAARVDSSGATAPAEAASDAQQELFAYFTALLVAGKHPPGSVLEELATAAGAEGGVSADEQVKIALDIAMAGNNSSAFAIGNGALALLEHGDQLAELRAHPQLMRNAVDEMIRYDSPNQIVMRFAAADVTLGGRKVAAGEAVFALVGAANRDPEQFPDPERFDVRREGAHRHLSFGMGIHFCLGMPLLRLEAELAFNALLERFPALRLHDRGIERGGTLTFRGLKRLEVVGQE